MLQIFVKYGIIMKAIVYQALKKLAKEKNVKTSRRSLIRPRKWNQIANCQKRVKEINLHPTEADALRKLGFTVEELCMQYDTVYCYITTEFDSIKEAIEHLGRNKEASKK